MKIGDARMRQWTWSPMLDQALADFDSLSDEFLGENPRKIAITHFLKQCYAKCRMQDVAIFSFEKGWL